ncbi:MAG: DUF4129 domain-containing protein [Dermatophilaceae bacterium]|nr:DUF4129 domain-containing protein [Actinomycetales bacterium]
MRLRGGLGTRIVGAVAAVTLGVWLTSRDYVLFPQSTGLGRGGSVTTYQRYEGVVDAEGSGGQLPAWVTVVLLACLGLVGLFGLVVFIRRWPRRQREIALVRPDADDGKSGLGDDQDPSRVLASHAESNEITRAWRAVELTLEDDAHHLKSSRTSRTVLGLAVAAGASHGPALALADLYDHTRYSGQETVPADRARATTLSARIVDELRR